MIELQNPYIKLKPKLDKKDYKDINNLKRICLEYDKTSLKLELDYKLKREDLKSEKLKFINEFMYYDQNSIIGYIGICNFGGDEIEINGMVHPDYRRMGIFRELYLLVLDEWNKRAYKKMLFLSDHNSVAGLAFIKNIIMGAEYEYSEYEMFLKDYEKKEINQKKIILRKATNDDAKEIAFQNSIYFGMEIKVENMALPEDEEKAGMCSFIAEAGNQIIGKVNLELNAGCGGIYGLGVLPQYRNKGFGKEILIIGIEKLKAKKAKSIKLQVAVKNKNALNLYKSCGFEETSTMDYFHIIK
jgi:ribosomal protein S18 acetylase RimI-like enzyme